MEPNIFDKPHPFAHFKDESKLYSLTTKVLAGLFGNDQRNIIIFACLLGIPTIITCFVAMFIIAKNNIWLIVFDIALLIFCIVVFFLIYKMCKKWNNTINEINKINKTKD